MTQQQVPPPADGTARAGRTEVLLTGKRQSAALLSGTAALRVPRGDA
ncbi:hypothetical protein [Streptomyces sp. bgisy060]